MKIRIRIDRQKAKALAKTANETLARLKELNKEKYPSNTLTDYYDIIHKLMEALSLTRGMKVKGEGAHQELIDYVCKENDIPEQDRIFLQDLREQRNRISYEGFSINKNYIKNNTEKIESIITRLKTLLQDYL